MIFLGILEKKGGVRFMGYVLAVAAAVGLGLLIYLFVVLFRGEKL